MADGARKNIPVFRPSFGEEELQALREPLLSGWVGTGPKTAEFERRFAAYVGSPQAVAVSSCTAALYLAFQLADLRGGEVVTTPLTFVATNHAILAAGGVPVFADIEPDTLNVDPADVERKITPRTKALVVVHLAGHACRMRELSDLASARGLVLIEDCAHATGAAYEGRSLGTLGDFGCFSFQAIKNLSTGDGGMVTLADAEKAARLRRLTWLGIDKGSWERTRGGYGWDYDVTELGLKFQMNDIAAAIGLVQLDKLERANARRRALVERYSAALAGLDGVEIPVEKPYARSSWHTYILKVARAEWRNRLVDHLADQGVAATVHYPPTHLFRLYEPYRVPLPVTEGVWRRLISLPLFPDLGDDEQDRVIDAVRGFLQQQT